MKYTRLLLFLITCSLAQSAFSQKIVDSLKVYEFPVREGVVHIYEAKSVYASYNAMPIMNVMTAYDSVFHFEDGAVTDVRKVGSVYAVCIQNKKSEIVVYSNIAETHLKKGDNLKRGKFVGTLAHDFDGDWHEVDVMIFQKGKEIPYKKIMDYMQRYISSDPPRGQTL